MAALEAAPASEATLYGQDAVKYFNQLAQSDPGNKCAAPTTPRRLQDILCPLRSQAVRRLRRAQPDLGEPVVWHLLLP